ncbi:hypothetical protein F5X98DRAFT_232403 [Xylaria grammica]|nr:hypothetical protein F5X98DRAFT_232403 [Xylaria grammica]
MPLEAPNDSYFTTFEEGFEAWQSHALGEGFAIKKATSQDKRDGQYTRHVIRCTASSSRPSVAITRKTSTSQEQCPFEGVGKLYKHAELWSFTVKHRHHNHIATFSTPIHRRREMTDSAIACRPLGARKEACIPIAAKLYFSSSKITCGTR